jgi:hypothetical protein
MLGTQMERHIGKRLGIPCAVISAPVHVQDFPARYSPQMGFEGANVLFDTWVHPLVMGLEEHLLHMFRDDFEFHDEAGAVHHGGKAVAPKPVEPAPEAARPRHKPGPRRRKRRWVWLRRCRARAEEDPVLRARQGAAQHRKLRRRTGIAEISVDTLVRGKGPLCAMTWSYPRLPRGDRHARRPCGGPCGAGRPIWPRDFPGLTSPSMPPPNGARPDALEPPSDAVATGRHRHRQPAVPRRACAAILPALKARRDAATPWSA